MSSFFQIPIRNWWGAILIVGACLAPGRASASCGDYLTINNARSASEHQTPQPTNNQQPGVLETPRPIKSPCRGPQCSGIPVHDPAPIAPVTSPTSQAKELTLHTSPTCDSPEPCTRLFSGQPYLPTLLFADAIFHPPRLA
jgi:hypothetical protein